MKIAIDISQIVYGTGVSTYTKSLVENLLRIDKENEYVLFGGSLRRRHEIRQYFHTLQGLTLQSKVLPISPSMADFLWNRAHILPVEKLVGKVDVFHSSDWSQPPSRAFKVTTVHDLVPILYPKQSGPKIVAVHMRKMEWVKKEVDRIIVPSGATKKDLVKLGYDEKKIKVIPEAPDERFKPAGKAELQKVKKRHSVNKKYLLAVGVAPRKNTKRIIKAYKQLEKIVDFELLIIGHKYANIEEVDGVRLLGHIEDKDIPILFSGAEALIYPSLYEGFGLPILEAMACECPVVTSNASSMPEVAGDAAVLVDPESTLSISGGIEEAILNRQKYINKGKKRVKQFTWDKTAKETLKVYKEVKKC